MNAKKKLVMHALRFCIETMTKFMKEKAEYANIKTQKQRNK